MDFLICEVDYIPFSTLFSCSYLPGFLFALHFDCLDDLWILWIVFLMIMLGKR